MRIWSIDPKYLDVKGLVAAWREALLAKNVLLGKTKGYVNHPQLNRFKNIKNPVNYIDLYLNSLYEEALKRNYKFDKTKIGRLSNPKEKISITNGQIKFEFDHLLKKLKIRDLEKYKENLKTKKIDINPIFKEVKGKIENWEKINENRILTFNQFINEKK